MKSIRCLKLQTHRKQWRCEFTTEFKTGKWYVLTGESGSGKSTLLNLMIGLETPISGDILMGENSIAHLPPHCRDLSLMTQSSGLFPGVTILENLKLAMSSLKSTNIPPGKKNGQSLEKIMELCSSLQLDDRLLSRYTHELSGGQLSRFNLVRAILRDKSWLLLDEPFAAVDRPTRLNILSEISKWQQKTQRGVLLVAHDLDDIFTVASDIVVIQDGHIVGNQNLQEAIDVPQHVATARLLRAGILIEKNGAIHFVPAAKIATSEIGINCPPPYLRSLVLKSPKITVIGSVMRITDLSSLVDLTVPFDKEFTQHLWYDQRDIYTLLHS